MSECPTCGKPVDPLRARSVGVRDGKIVGYCSPECLAAAESSSQPVTAPTPTPGPPRPATPPRGVVQSGNALDSGPVIEIQYGTPPRGVPGKDATPVPEDQAKAKAKDATPPQAKPKDGSKSKDRDKDKDKDKDKDQAKAKAKSKAKDATPPPKAKDAPKTEDAPKAKAEATPAPSKPAATPARPDANPASGPTSAATVARDDATPAPRRPGRETIARDERNASQAEDWLDDEPAEIGDLDDEDIPSVTGSSRRVVVALLVVLIVAAGGVLAYKFIYLQRSAARTQETGSDGSGSAIAGSGSGSGSGSARVASGSAQVEVPAAAIAKDVVLERATKTLREYMGTKGSPRVQRLAAMALSRTGDATAIDRLVKALTDDELEQAGRLEVAYALARAGNRRGHSVLVSSLSAQRRDDKLVAGRLLVQLGDTRAVDTLAAYLGISQHRLGAAEQLARLGEPRALKVLEQIREDPKASADDKARAVIALGYAGKDVTKELHALLDDPRFNTFAADALAFRHDEAARPVLAKLLDVSALRVGAARALRRLAPDRDPAPYVRTLVAALDSPRKHRDTEQIRIAEALLLLVGPASWSEHP